MGGLVVKVKGSHKRIHVKGEARTWGDRQKEAHSGGNVEDEVSEDDHHSGRPWANMGVCKWPRNWLLTRDSSGGTVASDMPQKVAAMAAPVNMAWVSG
jgi:hypothetical protein